MANKSKKQETQLDPRQKATFERWEIRINENVVKGKVQKSFEKLKLLKAAVKITPEQAHTLNLPIVEGNYNKFAEVYYLPSQDEIFLLSEEAIA